MLNKLKKDLAKFGNPEKAKILSGFFKTGKGQYGEGDVFLGITSPKQREIAKKYSGIGFSDLQSLLNSKIHEHRQTAVIILALKYAKSNETGRKNIFNFYLKNTRNINNWDLVDISCHKIIGKYLSDKNKSVLYKLAKSQNLWQRRIAIISTFAFIRNNEFYDTIKISEILLNDRHDLIQKAVGWALREMGKKDEKELIKFLDKHYRKMPRTMLRYAIERLDEKKKEVYMIKLI